MLLVILGAGASYDSAPSRFPVPQEFLSNQYRPPLANGLFEDRGFFGPVLQKYSRCLPIVTRLRHIAPNSSVEAELQRLQAERGEYHERHAQLAAIRYYLQEILWVCGKGWQAETHFVSNYSTLVDDIKRWKKPNEKVCLVTFNYDTLLDDALVRAGYPFRDMPSYIASDLMLVKLHGSVNWGRKVNMHVNQFPQGDGPELARALIDRYSMIDLQMLEQYFLIGEYPPAHRDNMPVVPALAIPVEEKLDFECPVEHVDALKAFLPQVTKILTIGWRGTEKSFLELLQHGLGTARLKVMTVSGTEEESKQTAQKLKNSGINGPFKCLDCGFTEFTTKKFAAQFLAR